MKEKTSFGKSLMENTIWQAYNRKTPFGKSLMESMWQVKLGLYGLHMLQGTSYHLLTLIILLF